MHGVVAAVVAGAGVVSEQVDPTVQPVRQSFYVFVFLASATVLLLVSMLRHMRRAHTNLGTAASGAALDAADVPGADDGGAHDRGAEPHAVTAADQPAGSEGDAR